MCPVVARPHVSASHDARRAHSRNALFPCGMTSRPLPTAGERKSRR